VCDGYGFWWCASDFLFADLRARRRLPVFGGESMNMFYVIGAGVAVLLLIYLVVALVNAEKL
jgi:K+-transporting ATPase KdpF subunit